MLQLSYERALWKKIAYILFNFFLIDFNFEDSRKWNIFLMYNNFFNLRNWKFKKKIMKKAL